MKNIKLTLTVAFLSLFLTATADAVVITVDEFSDPSSVYLLPAYGTTETWSGSGLSQVIGGSRRIDYTRYHDWFSGGGAGQDWGDDFVIYSGWWNGSYHSEASMNCSAGGWGKFYLTYDADGAGLNMNLSQGDHFEVNFWADHLGFGKPSIMSFTLTDGNGTSYTSAKSWYPYVVVQSWWTELFALNNFAAHGVDVSDIDSIQFYYEGDWANDLSFKNILVDPPDTNVPEPSTAALLLLSLGGVLRLCLKKKHS